MAGWVDALELLDLSALPALNATLNGLATVLLIVGLADPQRARAGTPTRNGQCLLRLLSLPRAVGDTQGVEGLREHPLFPRLPVLTKPI